MPTSVCRGQSGAKARGALLTRHHRSIPRGFITASLRREHQFANRAQASEGQGSITAVSFDPLSSALAAEIDRAATAAPAGAEQVTVELAISPDGQATPPLMWASK